MRLSKQRCQITRFALLDFLFLLALFEFENDDGKEYINQKVLDDDEEENVDHDGEGGLVLDHLVQLPPLLQ